MAATLRLTRLPILPPLVSVPYSSGQWLQHLPFSRLAACFAVSVPYSSGQWLQPSCKTSTSAELTRFQSPIHRVNGCNKAKEAEAKAAYDGFSPLFIGSMAATVQP